MHVAMAMMPPRRLSGKTPKVSIARTASIAILIKIRAMSRPFPAKHSAGPTPDMRPGPPFFQPGSSPQSNGPLPQAANDRARSKQLM